MITSSGTFGAGGCLFQPLIAGHLDTVPVADNLPSRVVETSAGVMVHGRGTCDMKGGIAVALKLACELTHPRVDVTWIFYDNEEVESHRNGLGRLARNRPELLEADFAVLMEPTAARIEGGCQSTIRVRVRAAGQAAHSARAWMGHNAIVVLPATPGNQRQKILNALDGLKAGGATAGENAMQQAYCEV